MSTSWQIKHYCANLFWDELIQLALRAAAISVGPSAGAEGLLHLNPLILKRIGGDNYQMQPGDPEANR
jgi:hypothetical protein